MYDQKRWTMATMLLLCLALTTCTIASPTGLSSPLTVQTYPNTPPGAAVTDLASFKLITSVINNSNRTLKLLNDPRTPLSTWATPTFTVTNAADPLHGSVPRFTGVHVRYTHTFPDSAGASTSSPALFTVLDPGEVVNVTHEVGRYYDFRDAGPGLYTFDPYDKFTSLPTRPGLEGDSDGGGGGLWAREVSGSVLEIIVARTIPATVFIMAEELFSATPLSFSSLGGGIPIVIPNNFSSSRINKRDSASRTSKRSLLSPGCTAEQLSKIESALQDSSSLAQNAVSHLQDNPLGSPLQTTWYGQFSLMRYNSTLSSFQSLSSISSIESSGWSFDCSSCTDSTTYAYVYPEEYGKLYLCGLFWMVKPVGPGSRADTIIHEGTHFLQILGTQDIVYGEDQCKSLAKKDAKSAWNNADNHAFFSDYV